MSSSRARRSARSASISASAAEPLRLCRLHLMTTLTGSALLALAVETGELDAEEAWAAAHVDEDWQIEQWGQDAEAIARRNNRKRDMMAAVEPARGARRDSRSSHAADSFDRRSAGYLVGRQQNPGSAGVFHFYIRCLHRVVHVEFDRVRGHFEAHDLCHLQLDVAVDLVVVEDAAGLQEAAVLVEALQRFAQRAADGRDLLQFLRRQVVEILVHRLAGMDLVLDAVEAGHQQGGEGEVGVRARIGEADFDALGLRR